MYGDLAAVHKLETRFAEVFPSGEIRVSSFIATDDIALGHTPDKNI